MKERRDLSEWTPVKLLAEAKRTRRPVEEMPPDLVREAMKRGFPDMRSIVLSPALIRNSLQASLLRDLLVSRIGYVSRAAGHFIPRPAGSLDHICLFCVAGEGWLRIQGRTWDIKADTAVFIPAGQPHWYGARNANPWSHYWIHFTGRQAAEYFAAFGTLAENPLLHLEANEELITAFREIEQFMTEAHTAPNLIAASGALARFLGLMQVRHYAVQPQQRSAEQNVEQTIRFMRENLNRPIALRELAQLAHMSVSHYEALFTRRAGLSPIQYLNQLRVQRACQLLSGSRDAIQLVASKIGMEDPCYFSRWFKKLIGVSPAEFRSGPRSLAELLPGDQRHVS